jgi:outer membrane lipoprotein SlyB
MKVILITSLLLLTNALFYSNNINANNIEISNHSIPERIMKINLDTDSINSTKLNWWNTWGRTTSGTIGGAGIGFLGGAAVGSFIPIIGSILGGVVGTITGGLIGHTISKDKTKKIISKIT